MSEVLQRRLKQFRSRSLVRQWEFRQRRHARGVWFRLRRVLADASEAYEIAEADADRLEAAGLRPELVGAELEPVKRMFFVERSHLADLASARPLALRLDSELLAARCVALIPFPAR